MSASTAERTDLARVAAAWLDLPVAASTTIYAGTCVGVDTSTGGIKLMADAANLVFLGTARQTVDNSAGSLGDKRVQIEPNQLLKYLEVNATSAAVTWVGKMTHFSDDNTVVLGGSSTNKNAAGRCVGYISASRVIIDVTDRALIANA